MMKLSLPTLLGVLIACSSFNALADDPVILDSTQRLTKIAFGSCIDQRKPAQIFEPINAYHPELFIFLGDNIYSDTDDIELKRAGYRKQDEQEGLIDLREYAMITGTWDDHDYGINDSGSEYGPKEGSRAAMMEFFREPEDGPRSRHDGAYHSLEFGPKGQRVQVIMLDTRWFRDQPDLLPEEEKTGPAPYRPTDDTSKTILGKKQWAWLKKQLKRSAELRILVSSIQVISDEHGWEGWHLFPHERERLFDLIKDTKANGVIVLSGDRHAGEISLLEDRIGYPLYDITSSGLNQGRPAGEDPNDNRVGELCPEFNFGTMTIDWDAEEPTVKLRLEDFHGAERAAVTLPLAELVP